MHLMCQVLRLTRATKGVGYPAEAIEKLYSPSREAPASLGRALARPLIASLVGLSIVYTESRTHVSTLLGALMTLRVAAVTLLSGWAIAFLTFGVEWWRIAVLASLPVPIAITAVRLRRNPDLSLSVVIAMVLIGQSLFVVVTGGIFSPLCPALLVTTILAAVSIPPGRIPWPILIAVAVLIALATATSMSFDFRPHFLAPPNDARLAWAIAACLGVLIVVGARVGGRIRQAFVDTETQANALRTEALDAMSARNKDLVAMTSAIAHEVKNPLSAIQGLSTYMAEEAPEGSAQAEQLEVLVREVRRTSQIVEDFLNFSRPIAPDRLELVQLDGLADAVIAVHRGLAAQKKLDLQRIGTGLQARCDPRKLQHALVNLVQNALEATPSGGKVQVHLEASDGEARMIVIDGGPGLPPGLSDQVFKPGVTTRGQGSGLGLPIAQAMLAAHSGRVELSDHPEGGCRAALIMPIDGPDEETNTWPPS